MPDSTLWDADPHTFMKHHILKKYLGAWYAKLGQTHSRVVFIDGFAGPGEYASGEPGSPIVALDAAIEHRADLSRCEFVFLFIEQRKDRADHLEGLIAQRVLPKNIKYQVINDAFERTITQILDSIEKVAGGRVSAEFRHD